MSSIRKYYNNKWMKFAETNANNNVDVEDINTKLIQHDNDITELRKNVSWLALHGGGGSGGGGGGSTSRKARCNIQINNQTGIIAIAKGENLVITLKDISGAQNTIPWTIETTFDGNSIDKTSQYGDTITHTIEWNRFKSYFEGSGITKIYNLTVHATYNDPATLIEGESIVNTSIYIPTINAVIKLDEQNKPLIYYNKTNEKINYVLEIDSSSIGYFNLTLDLISHDNTSYPTIMVLNNYNKSISGIVSCRDDIDINDYKTGYYTAIFKLFFSSASDTEKTLVYTITKNIIINDGNADVFIKINDISQSSTYDNTNSTIIYDNTNTIYFSFIAIYSLENASSSYCNYQVSFQINGETDTYVLFSSYRCALNANTPVNHSFNNLSEFKTALLNSDYKNTDNGKLVKVILTITMSGINYNAYAYFWYKKGDYQFIKFTVNAERNRLLLFDAQSIEAGIQTKTTILSKDDTGDDNLETELTFYDINSRSYVDYNKFVIELRDTYITIDKFNHHTDSGDFTYELGQQADITLNICYKTPMYNTNNHTVLAMINSDGKGIYIKNNGVYFNNTLLTIINSSNIVSIYIIYHNDTADSANNYIKIYIDGVITRIQKGNQLIIGDKIKVYINGYNTTQYKDVRQELCNCDIYNLEIFKTNLNELDILASYINDKIKYSNSNNSATGLDFNIISSETIKNYCSYNNEDNTISSSIYNNIRSTKYQYKNDIFLSTTLNGEEIVPVFDQEYATDESIRNEYVSKLSVLGMPITYLEILDSTENQWTFDNFIKTGNDAINISANCNFYYWDVINSSYPISSDQVNIRIQGTSTKQYQIKNIELTFNQQLKNDRQVQDLFYVKSDWLPENSYVLKADIVDSSHSNNASIGKFINDNFEGDNSYNNFKLDNIFKNNFITSIDNLSSDQSWIINRSAKCKHTIEGFQTILLVKFNVNDSATAQYTEFNHKFVNLGIYSFNIGRNAARNLGFDQITRIYKLEDDGETENLITNVRAPCILKDVIVESNTNISPIYWFENKESKNFIGISALNYNNTEISGTQYVPEAECRFWHYTVNANDKKLNHLFQLQYANAAADQGDQDQKIPSTNSAFNTLVKNIATLPIEGFLKTDNNDWRQWNDIFGQYPAYTLSDVTYKDGEVTGGNYEKVPGQYVTLNQSSLEDINLEGFDVDQFISYYIIALLFGLIDNLDKNISFRTIRDGNDRTYIDFYDMDTALGLNNVGDNKVSPTVGVKYIKNDPNIDVSNEENRPQFPYETFDVSDYSSYFDNSQYNKFLPEVYSNKIWLSLDTRAIKRYRNEKLEASLYSDAWFKIRQYLDNIARDNDYQSFIDYFMNEYFINQIKCGTLIYNYDYTIKYINDYSYTTDTLPSNNTIEKLHGRRIAEAREWLQQHINYLDSYFYWRNNHTYTINQTSTIPSNLNTILQSSAIITLNTATPMINIETIQPIIITTFSTGANFTSDTFIPQLIGKNVQVASGGTGQTLTMNMMNLVKSLNLSNINISKFIANTGTSFSAFEELILDNLHIDPSGLSLDDFIGQQSLLKKISARSTKFTDTFSLDLNNKNALDVSYIDIASSTGIQYLHLYNKDGTNITQNLKYLDIANSDLMELHLFNQTYLVLPDVNMCTNLLSIVIDNCNLTNLDESRKTQTSSYMYIDLSAQHKIKFIDINDSECIKSINISNSSTLTALNLCNLSNLLSVEIDGCNILNNVKIKNCNNLTSININNCKIVNNFELHNLSSLSILNMYDNPVLSSIYLTKNSVENIVSCNMRNIAISGFNFYNEMAQQYDDIIKDPNDNIVLDFKDFTSLTNVIIYQYGELKCQTSQYQACRFPNNPDIAFHQFPIRQYPGNAFVNLKNIYGNIKIIADTAFPASCDMFLSCDNEDYNYKGYPPFLSTICDSSDINNINNKLSNNTIFDLLCNKYRDIRSAISSKNILNNDFISTYYPNKFLSYDSVIQEFDDREWATNYIIHSMSGFTKHKGHLNPMILQYLLYRYAIFNNNKQITSTPQDIRLLSPYVTSSNKPIVFPSNTFKYIGRTLRTIARMFYINEPPVHPGYIVNYDVMKHIPNISCYTCLGDKEFLYYNALSACDNLRMLGSSIGESHLNMQYTSISGYDIDNDGIENQQYIQKFFNETLRNLPSLTSISKFNITNTDFELSSIQMPYQLKSICNSLTSLTNTQSFSFDYMFSDSTDLCNITNSFGQATMYIKSNSFNSVSQLRTCIFNSTAKKILLLSNETLSTIDETNQFSQNDFNDFLSNILSCNTKLTNTSYLLANIEIPYPHITDDNDNYIPYQLNKSLLSNNNQLTTLNYFFANQKFPYAIVSGLFENNTNIQSLEGAFSNDTADNTRGISSCIPYKFLYHGKMSDKSNIISGTNRFDHEIYNYNEFKTNIENLYKPKPLRVNQTTTNDYAILSNMVYKLGLLNNDAFNYLSNTYNLTGNRYMHIPTDIEYIKDHLPIAEYVYTNPDDEDSSLVIQYNDNENVSKFVNTLSTIHSQITDANWRKMCDLSSVKFSYTRYNRKIINIDKLFACNPNIQPYDGKTITEINTNYNPFILNFASNKFKINNQFNTYLSDDSWSHNGQIYDDDGEYDPNLLCSATYNIVSSDMKIISCNDPTSISSKYNNITKTYDNIVAWSRYTTAGSDNVIAYKLTYNELREFRYICSPDLFRYCNNSLRAIQYTFASCDMLHRHTREDVNTHKFSPDTANIGITGRIPPNLLNPLPNLNNITGLFKYCYHITGYDKLDDSDSGTYTYLIPEQFFNVANKIQTFMETFMGTTLYGNVNFKAFNSLQTGSKSTKLNIQSIFNSCVWCCFSDPANTSRSGKINLPPKYYSNINYAFKNALGTMNTFHIPNQAITVSQGVFAKITKGAGDSTGNTIKPYLENFTRREYIPSTIIQTYYVEVSPQSSHGYHLEKNTQGKYNDVAANTLSLTSQYKVI